MAQSDRENGPFRPHWLDKTVWAFSRISKRPDVYVAEWVLGAGLIADTLVCYRFLVAQGVVQGVPVEPLPLPTWLVLLSLFVVSFVLIHWKTHSLEKIEAIHLTGMERRVYSTFGLLVAFGWGPGTMLIAITNGAVFL